VNPTLKRWTNTPLCANVRAKLRHRGWIGEQPMS
jgi:hypothetical protein